MLVLHGSNLVGVGVGEGVADAEGVGVGVAEGVGVATGTGCLTATPLFHTNFFPDLMQVYLIPDDVLVLPSTLQAVPGLTAASATG
ncbi:hypothetical protein A7sIIA15_04705 [Candidatus Planktophila vernalis]|uniref:Uncharacterized protein n=1 Tax=Candidatus Planktophila vernalis TaxID=1884907 RepID=A0A249KTM9_9ACTN|nr:hypothetical protein A7sIIA15_04705 [Candidatus Planktophila vernalis]